MIQTLLIKMLALWIIFRTAHMRKVICDFLLLGGDKGKMVARIKELHRLNDGSYKSSNSIIIFKAPYGEFRIQHKHGYVSVSYKRGEDLQWCYYLTSPVDLHDLDIIDFEEEARERLYPVKKCNRKYPRWDKDDYYF